MLKVHRSNPRLAAMGMIDMFAGRPTVSAMAAAIRYQTFIEHQISFVKAHKAKV